MGDSVLKTKSYSFAIRIVRLSEFLRNDKKEFTLSKQVLRSGTSIGASIREAEFAQSDLDFIHKFSISLKEANETMYWLELLKETKYIEEKNFTVIYSQATEVLKIIKSIIITTKKNLQVKN